MVAASQRTRRALAVLAPNVFGMLGLSGVLCVLGALRLRAETIHVLHFDDLAEGRTFRTRSQPYAAAGVTIHGTGETGGSVPTVIRPAPGAGTPPHCLVNDYAYGSEFGSVNQDLVIDLDGYTADFVSVDAGLAEDSATGSVTGRMTAYQKVVAPGGAIGYSLIPHGSASRILGRLAVAPDPSRSLIVEDPEGRIGRLVISYGISGDPGGAGMSGWRELIDTVVIRESEEPPPPPEDTTDPVVDITGPEQDSSVPHRTVHVLGYVDENVGLERVLAQHGGRDTPLAFTGMARRFFFAGTVQLEEGSWRRSIAVYAEDLFGNFGRQTVEVDYEPVEDPAPPTPPPPNLDLVALGMEVTQAIQGWGMVGETPQDVDNRTRLIAGKRTLVRVYAETRGVDVSIPDVRCDLRAYRGAAELAGSPLGSLNRVALEPGETHLEQRPAADKSFNFFLPPEWTAAGDLLLRATVNPWNGAGERLGAFDVYNDAVRDVDFHDTEELCVIFYALRATANGNAEPTWDEVADNVDLLRQCYPVAAERLSMVLSGTIETDIDIDEDNDLNNLLRGFRRSLGFYRGQAIAVPCKNTAYVGLISPSIGDIGGMADYRFPVCISYAGDVHGYRERTAHEVGHLMGLDHVAGCADPAGVNEGYPDYPDPVLPHTWYPDASIGEWGAEFHDDDTFDVLDPAGWGDLLSYCLGTRWISPYTHDWLFGHFTSGGGGAAAAGGGAADAPYLLVNGTIELAGKAALDPTWSAMLPAGSADREGLGPWRIDLVGGGGETLFTRRFAATPLADRESHAFIDEAVPALKGLVEIRLSGGSLVAPVRLRAGVRPPSVVLASPVGGESWPATGTESIRWSASDPDGDPLAFAVSYSHDLGSTWEVLASDSSKPGLTVRLEALRGGGKSCLVRVAASDGIHVDEAISPLPFSKEGQPPLVVIAAPRPVRSFAHGKPVLFESLVTDREDGTLPGESLRWTSSLDGPLGVGASIASARLRPGLHAITLEAVDSEGMVGSDATGIFIESPEATAVDLPETGQTKCYAPAGAAVACAGTGQDGELRSGVPWPAPRFAVKADETALDLLTGLVWARDAFTPILPDCKGGAMAWGAALDYVECLNERDHLGHRDWRLPNAIELLSLAAAGEGDLAAWLEKQGFTGVGAGEYWSSTTSAADSGSAWHASLATGAAAASSKARLYRVWPVRSKRSGLPDRRFPANLWRTGPTESFGAGDDGALQVGAYWASPRFTDHGNGTVTDNLTGLMWLKDPACLSPRTWQGALDVVAELNALNARPDRFKCRDRAASYRDWRLPNRIELLSLIDFSRSGPALPPDHLFFLPPEAQLGSFWTSTSAASAPGQAWAVDLGAGSLAAAGKEASSLGVLAVRGGSSAPSSAVAHLVLSARDEADPVPAGGRVAYALEVGNFGPDAAARVVLTSRCPPESRFISAASPLATCREAGGIVTCEAERLARGESFAVRIEVRAPEEPGVLRFSSEVDSAAGDPNTTDNSAEVATAVLAGQGPAFRRGYANPDKRLDLSDAVYVLGYLFLGQPQALPCRKAADADDDGRINITDPVYLLSYLFTGGKEPPPPFAACGLDPTGDRLECEAFPACE